MITNGGAAPGSALVTGLERLFDLGVSGIFGVSGVEAWADAYLSKAGGDVEAAIRAMTKWQVSQASILGFGLNLGGLVTVPVTIPVEVASTAMLQLRLIAGIAHLRGHDIHSQSVRTFAIGCLIGDAFVGIAKRAGIQFGQTLGARAINQVSGTILLRINQAIGFRFITKGGATGMVNLMKLVPVIGGVVGAAFDGASTAAVAATAKRVFSAQAPSGTEGGSTAPTDVQMLPGSSGGLVATGAGKKPAAA